MRAVAFFRTSNLEGQMGRQGKISHNTEKLEMGFLSGEKHERETNRNSRKRKKSNRWRTNIDPTILQLLERKGKNECSDRKGY